MAKEFNSPSNWRKKVVGKKKDHTVCLAQNTFYKFRIGLFLGTWWLDLIQYKMKCQRESGIKTKKLPLIKKLKITTVDLGTKTGLE